MALVTLLTRAIISMVLMSGCAPDPCPTDREAVVIGGETFCMELAITDKARADGLMFRQSIDPHGGMLFVFPDVQIRSFWMKNCETDMDLIFLDATGRVVARHEMTVEEPWNRNRETEGDYERRLERYTSRLRAQFALEFAPGTILGPRCGSSHHRRRVGLHADGTCHLGDERSRHGRDHASLPLAQRRLACRTDSRNQARPHRSARSQR
jgi:uncharacterized membrane protein (UPF0127 family)